jgi:ribosome biogenesis GTPase A
MARTVRDIQEIKLVDLVIELVDARAIKSSSNNELVKQIQKPRITIAVKGDLADVKQGNDILICSLKDSGTKKKLIEKLYSNFKDKITKYKAKGLLVPQFYILIVGMPNIGKSSLINYLSKGSKLIVENRPGVTKRKQLIKINENFLLYDTPGVMVKKIDDDEDGYRLGLINAISKKVIPMEDTME